MVRRLLAVCLCVAVPIGALCAPLVHAHLGDHHDDHHDDHQGANFVHAHLGGHDVDHHLSSKHDVALEAPDDPEQATGLQIYVAVRGATPPSPALPPARYTLSAPLASVMRRPPAVTHSHDPPRASSTGPRAPPAFPS